MKELERLLGLLESMELEVPPGELGSALTGPLAPLEGALLAERYRVRALLGVGGMGKVLLADDEQIGRPVTLKLLRDAPTEEALERLRREAIVAARLSHPNVVRVHELVETAGQVLVVAEYVAGARALDEAWRGQPLATRLELLLQVADGLAAAHAAGVVHRDVKPENVLVDEGGRARLSDFGIATGRDLERLTQSGTILGSPSTMSPEQARGEAADARADVWSLGVLLYLALYDELPFTGESLAELLNQIGQLEPSYPSRPEVSAALRRECARALRKDPAGRHADAGAFASALRGARDHEPTPWLLRGGIAVLALALAWLWFAPKTPAPVLPASPADVAASATPQTSSPALPARAPQAEPPRRLALTEDLLCVETSRGVELWELTPPARREALAGRRLGQESAPKPPLVPADPPALLVREGASEAVLREERLELRGSGPPLRLALPESRPTTFQALALTPSLVVLVCGAEKNGSRVLAWRRSNGAPLELAGSQETYLTPRAIALSPSGARLAVGGYAGLLVVFDLDEPDQPPQVLSDPKQDALTPRAHRFDRMISGLTFPSDDELLSANGLSLALWRLPSGALQARRPLECYQLASREGRVAYGGRFEVLVDRWSGALPKHLR